MTSQGRRSQGAGGAVAPLFLEKFVHFHPKNPVFKKILRFCPPVFQSSRCCPPCFLELPTGLLVYVFFSFIFCILFQLQQRPLQSKSYLLTPKNKKSTNFWSNLRNTKKIPNVTFAICTCYKA